MQLTNKYNLPEAIVAAVSYNNYHSGKQTDFSVTELLKPPRQRILQMQYEEFIEEDVSEHIWRLIGDAVHVILERSESEAKTEQRYACEVEDHVIAGKFDRLHIESGTLQDYKIMSVWEVMHGIKDDRISQLNMYRYLLHRNEIEVNKLEVVAIFRDWSKTKAGREKDYPQEQVARINVPLWDFDYTEKFIRDRIQVHVEAENAENQNELVECTPSERWLRGESWAVMKKGRKSAVKLHNEKWKAEKHLESCDKNNYIEHRPGINMRCENYCNVAPWCLQFKKLKETQ